VKTRLALIVGSLLVLALGFAGAYQWYKRDQASQLAILANKDFSTFVPAYAPKLGPENPQVYLTEFLDPECEACRAFHPLVKELMNEFAGQVQLVIRYAPFHPNSMMVAKILEASRAQGRYWETLEVLFDHQPRWGDHHHPRPEVVWEVLPEAGVDVERIRAEMESPEIAARLEQDRRDLETLHVRQTPTFFVNGQRLQTFGKSALRDLIKENLAL
jgi:protein-disulfide isomerase